MSELFSQQDFDLNDNIKTEKAVAKKIIMIIIFFGYNYKIMQGKKKL